MLEIKVKELMEILKTIDQEAVICSVEICHDEPTFSFFEICREFKGVKYINDEGEEGEGNVLAIY